MYEAIAFDVGTKNIGIALYSKPDIFLPYKTIQFNNDTKLLKIKLAILKKQFSKIKCSIIGLSKYEETDNYIKQVFLPIYKKEFANIKYFFIDESNTTQQAQTLISIQNNLRTLPRRIRKKDKSSGIIDSTSALILLYKAYEENIIPCN